MAVDVREDRAIELDAGADPATRRELFLIPPAAGGDYPLAAYLAGNSLGLQPRAVRDEVIAELDAWAKHGVLAHHEAVPRPWGTAHEVVRDPLARLVGALPHEVVAMNALTVNIHLLLASFYRPTSVRHRIVIEDQAFSSDSYAVRSHVALRGFDPDTAVMRLRPRAGEHTLRLDDVLSALRDHAHSIATVLLGGVNYLTGELLDIAEITSTGHEIGATVGWDLAHAVGNVPLQLHDWDVDFAAWCTYKYLNAGPGAVAAAYIHERHSHGQVLPRLEGWFGTDPHVRFDMHPVSAPQRTADAWAVSNSSVLSLAPLHTSLRIFDEVGMDALRARSLRLTGYLRGLLEEIGQRCALTVLTPADDAHHGAQLSARVDVDGEALCERLNSRWGVVCDERRPNTIRLAPTPLYSTFLDCWRAADALSRELTGSGLG